MMHRRQFLLSSAALPAVAAPLTPRQRVERVLEGKEVDRLPYTCWYHFLDEKQPGSVHAENTLRFHRKFRTDLVKVMSDYPFPRPRGKWHELQPIDNPFPEQIRALEIIRNSLAGRAFFIETVFNPWNIAEKLSSKEEVLRLKQERPQALIDALEAIAKSLANHARKAIQAGAAGVFLAVANAQSGILTREEYVKFSQPFDRMVLEAVGQAPLNTLHIHGEKVYLDLFYQGWPARILHYSVHASGIPIAQVRRRFAEVIMGGIDERNFRLLETAALKRQIAAEAAGRKYIVAPGCSVPNDSTDAEIERLAAAVGA